MDGRFSTKCVRNIIEKAVSICVTIPQNRKVKKNSTSHYRSKFQAQWCGDKLAKRLESLEEKKAVHTSCKHGISRICQLYTKGGPASKLTWSEPLRDHLDYRRRDNIQRYQAPKTVTTSPLEECDFKHALGARTHSIPHRNRKCQKTYRKAFWLLIFYEPMSVIFENRLTVGWQLKFWISSYFAQIISMVNFFQKSH